MQKKINEYRNFASFLCRRSKGVNYGKNCMGSYTKEELEKIKNNSKDIIRQYTSGSGWYCTTINLLLAADHHNLENSEFGKYVKELKCCIGLKKNLRYKGTVYRGLNMSPIEILTYKFKKMFYIPSFVSTSTGKDSAFIQYNTLIEIDLSEFSDYSGMITLEETDYPTEKECLISCYNIYEYIDYKNGVMKLKVKNYYQFNDDVNHCVKNNTESKDIVEVMELAKVPPEYFSKENSSKRNDELLNSYFSNPKIFSIDKK